jgi:hypothetical protein
VAAAAAAAVAKEKYARSGDEQKASALKTQTEIWALKIKTLASVMEGMSEEVATLTIDDQLWAEGHSTSYVRAAANGVDQRGVLVCDNTQAKFHDTGRPKLARLLQTIALAKSMSICELHAEVALQFGVPSHQQRLTIQQGDSSGDRSDDLVDSSDPSASIWAAGVRAGMQLLLVVGEQPARKAPPKSTAARGAGPALQEVPGWVRSKRGNVSLSATEAGEPAQAIRPVPVADADADMDADAAWRAGDLVDVEWEVGPGSMGLRYSGRASGSSRQSLKIGRASCRERVY